jgi:predicted signal transduction protein with EAL and GGDEF domain
VLLDTVAGAQGAGHVAAKARAAVQAPYRLDGHEVSLAASVGVGVIPSTARHPMSS